MSDDFGLGHTVNRLSLCTHTNSVYAPTHCRAEIEWFVRDYTQINQSTVTLHHIEALCDSESERRGCNLGNVLHVLEETAKRTM